MDKLAKALRKMSDDERMRVKVIASSEERCGSLLAHCPSDDATKGLMPFILQKILRGDLRKLDVKKLKGRDDIFRARSGNWRVIYRFGGKQALILAIERRNEKTYK